MKRWMALLCGLLLTLLGSSPLWASGLGVFPLLQCVSLSGHAVGVPGGLGGQKNVVIVAFQPQRQKTINTWFSALRQLEATHPQLRFYEMPHVSPNFRAFRPRIEAFMKTQLPDPALHSRVIPLYTEKAPLMAAVGAPNEQTVVVLLIDKNGAIHWRTTGAYTADKRRSLEQAL
jgi:hypothetical protein